MSKWSIPQSVQDPIVQKHIIDAQTKETIRKNEAGIMGFLFGTRYASSNIAGFISFSSVVIFIITIIFVNNDDLKNTIFQICSSLITLSLGYIFGKKSDN